MSIKDLTVRSLRMSPRATSALDSNPGTTGTVSYDQTNGTLRVAIGNSASNTLATRAWVLDNIPAPDLSNYVTTSSLSSTLTSYVTSSSLSSTLSGYVTTGSLSSTLSSYVTSSSLSSTLASYATTSSLSDYATTSSLSDYVTNSSLSSTLSSYALSSSLSDYLPLIGGTINGSLAFTGAGRRITGDFSNATVANRIAFQTSITNDVTSVAAIPNGTSNVANLRVYNNSDPTNAANGSFSISSSAVNLGSGITGSGTYLPMLFFTGGLERLRLDTSGNVQIGTTTSAGKVTIYDASAATLLLQGDTLASLVVQRASADTANPTMVLRKARGTIASPAAVSTGDNIGVVNFQAYGGSTNRTVAQILAGVEAYVSDTDIAGFLRFSTSSAGGTAVTEKMRITAAGDVGIGGIPSTRLQVIGGTSAQRRDSGDNLAFWGYVDTTDNSYIRLQNLNASVDYGQSNGFAFVNVNNNQPWYIATGGSERMRVDASGNVGIGKTASASVRLDVNGQINDTVGNVRSVPQNPQTTSYVLVAADNGRHVSITTGGVTVPASVFSAGDAVTIFNNSASSQTITQGANVTLRVAGTATTGTRTLAAFGLVTILCITGGANPTFVISGAGLS